MTVLKTVLTSIVLLAALVATLWRIPSTMHVSRVFAAPPDRIWRLWESGASIAQWWGPTGYTAPTVHSNFRIGGNFVLCMRSPEGKLFCNAGTYVEIQPRQRIVQRVSFADDQGRPVLGQSAPVPGRWPDQVTVTTEFHPLSGGTEVRIEERGIPMIMNLFARMGWWQQFDKIDRILGPK